MHGHYDISATGTPFWAAEVHAVLMHGHDIKLESDGALTPPQRFTRF